MSDGTPTRDAALAEVLDILREKMVVALSEETCGKKNCEHCRNMVLIFEDAVREAALARPGQEAAPPTDALRKALVEIVQEVERYALNGEDYRYPAGGYGGLIPGTITSKRGDLCDVRDAVQRIANRALRATPTGEGEPK